MLKQAIDNAENALKRAREYMEIDPAKLAAQAIIADINDRGGLKHEMRRVAEENPDAYKDIELTWEQIIAKCIENKKCDRCGK